MRSNSSRVSFGSATETVLFDRRKPVHESAIGLRTAAVDDVNYDHTHRRSSLFDLDEESNELTTPIAPFNEPVQCPTSLKQSWHSSNSSLHSSASNATLTPVMAMQSDQRDSFSLPLVTEADFPSPNPGLLKPTGKLGSGPFSEVFAAETPLGNLGVVKLFLLPKRDHDVRLLLEGLEGIVGTLRALEHPNLIRYHGLAVAPPKLHLYSEQAQASLQSLLALRTGPLHERTARQYSKAILTGLGFLHSHHVAHGALKPSNVLLASTGLIKLADYGMGTILQQFIPPSLPGLLYDAPEVLKGGPPAHAADVWSVGCIVAEMLTFRSPWFEFTDQSEPIEVEDLLSQILNSTDRPFADAGSPRAQMFLVSCLQRNPETRAPAGALQAHVYMQGV